MRTLLIIPLLAALAGCMPVYKTLQPNSSVVVKDTEGHPVEAATVQLITTSNPYNLEKGRKVTITDKEGVAQFDAKREWRIETFMLHGSETFYWDWCVQKPGYETYATEEQRRGWWRSMDAEVELKPGQPNEFPEYGR